MAAAAAAGQPGGGGLAVAGCPGCCVFPPDDPYYHYDAVCDPVASARFAAAHDIVVLCLGGSRGLGSEGLD